MTLILVVCKHLCVDYKLKGRFILSVKEEDIWSWSEVFLCIKTSIYSRHFLLQFSVPIAEITGKGRRGLNI